MATGKTHRLADAMTALLFLMVVLFPKGGLRLGALPITWGYLLLFVVLLVSLPARLLYTKAVYTRRQLAVLLCITPFAGVLFYSAYALGIPYMGGFVSSFVGLVFLPLLFLFYFPPLLPLLDRERFIWWLRFTVLAAALFGIFLFIWRPITGKWIQIPYLTVNADDAGDFANTKNIARGAFFKLISTYNNGNIYGAATLIPMRLYDEVTYSRWQRWVVKVALFLTLSRTIWVGLLADQFLSLGALLVLQRRNFPVVRLGRLTWGLLAMAAVVPLFLIMSHLMGVRESSGFLLDPTLGGRTAQFTQLGGTTFFPEVASSYFFTEITYLSAVNLYGYIGFPAITLVLLSPLLILLLDRRALYNPYRRAAFKGLVLYAIISTSDGAMSFIPVMAFYWFAYMIFLFGLPGHDKAHSAPLVQGLPLQATLAT